MTEEHNMYDYKKVTEEFEWDIPEYYNFAFDEVDERAKEMPDKDALISIDNSGEKVQRHTFKELSELSNKFANVLREKGMKKGDRAKVLIHRIPEWYVVMLGMMKIGVVPIPTPNLAVPEDITYRIERSEASTIVTDWSNHEKVEKVRDEGEMSSLENFILINSEEDKDGWENYEDLMARASSDLDREEVEPTKSDDPLLIYFTSGTTGKPKMVLHTHSYPLGHEVTARYVQDLRKEDINWTIADNGWAKAVWGKLFGQWIVGATVVQQNITGKFDPTKALKIIQDYNVTTFCVPPTIYKMMINEDVESYDLSSLRHCLSAGEPLNPDVIDKWEDYTGLRIYDYYGQTESVALVANYPTMEVKPGSMGKPTPGHEVDIIDDNQERLPPGEEGHIGLKVKPERPPGLFKEYWKDEDKTASVFEGDWYYTGDRAYKDEDGYFWFVGRADDVIKASGYRIGPFEVESALQEHPAVQEPAVIGAPHEVRGKIVKAYIILNDEYEPSEELVKELQDHVKEVTAPYKYPREIEFLDELPKTISGKIRRTELRDRAEEEYLEEHDELPY